MIVRYTSCPVRFPVPSLSGAFIIPCPIMAVHISGPSGSRFRDGLVDTGADETILDPTIAPMIGVDLASAVEREINLVGRGVIRCLYSKVTFRITDGVSETLEWETVAGFAPFPLLRNLLGFGGFLQYFDVNFRGANEDFVLMANALFPGKIY